MGVTLDLLAAVDAFMATEKRVVGFDRPPQWGPGYTPHERVMKYPLEVEGEQRGAQFVVVCFPRDRELRFRLGITFSGMICRLDYTDERHTNSLTGALTRAVPYSVKGPHYHSWPLNRRFFRGISVPPRLHDAAPFTEPAHTFDAALRWFCADTKIDALPGDHRIALPGLDLLV